MNSDKVHFCIDPRLPPKIFSRANYIFDIFCNVYSLKRTSEGRKVFYGKSSGDADYLSILCDEELIGREPEKSLSSIKKINLGAFEHFNQYDLKEIPIFSKCDEIDWIAHSFEFLSLRFEYNSQNRDSIGRLKYEDTIFGKHLLDPIIPYASIYFAYLYKLIFGHFYNGYQHINKIGISHDIDFLPTNIKWTLIRNIKYFASQLSRKEYSVATKTFFESPLQILSVKSRVGDIFPIVERYAALNLRATFNFIFSRTHHRDANYSINDELSSVMFNLLKEKHELGVHGSYNSMFQSGLLLKELSQAKELFLTRGHRAHWLRFPAVHTLIDIIESSDYKYDSSMGFSNQNGFRSGANFHILFITLARSQLQQSSYSQWQSWTQH